MTWIDLDLTIRHGRATLAAVNGMAFSENDSVHVCVRNHLRGLKFPDAAKSVKFSLMIDLSRPEPKDPQ